MVSTNKSLKIAFAFLDHNNRDTTNTQRFIAITIR